MKKRAFISTLLIHISTSLWVVADSGPPHIVLMIADDMGWGEVGFHGGRAETPNIDQLVSDGVELDRFYVHPVCSPTRTAMMTGRSPARLGITRPLSRDEGVPLDEHFMSESFLDAGYQTTLIGKWHLGAVGEAYAPLARGFKHFYGHRNGSIDYFSHASHGKPDWQRNGQQLQEEGYSTDLFADEAIKLIESRPAEKPLFLVMSFNAPHGPAQAPDALLAKYAKVSQNRKVVAKLAAIDSMDQAIGRILTALTQNEMRDETLVMFFCDNGGKVKPGELPEGSDPPLLRGGKSDLLEGGIRVPAVIRWPSHIKPGSRCDAFVSIADLYPTLAAAAGVPVRAEKPLDGHNMWPAIANGQELDNPLVISGEKGAFAAFHDPLKLIRFSDGREVLYDVRADPSETRDLSPNRLADKNRLQGLIRSLLNPH